MDTNTLIKSLITNNKSMKQFLKKIKLVWIFNSSAVMHVWRSS